MFRYNWRDVRVMKKINIKKMMVIFIIILMIFIILPFVKRKLNYYINDLIQSTSCEEPNPIINDETEEKKEDEMENSITNSVEFEQ